MGALSATLTAEDARAIYDRIDRIARSDARASGADRGIHGHVLDDCGCADCGCDDRGLDDRAVVGQVTGDRDVGDRDVGDRDVGDRGVGGRGGDIPGHKGRGVGERDGDDRSLDARRADVFAALLLGNRREHVQVEIQVIASVGTLAGLDDNPTELVGYGPIPARVGRALAADARWRRVLTDPDTGTVLDLGHRRVPTPALARLLRHQQTRCAFPGCGVPAARCDLDHTVAHAAGGRTALDNIGTLCRHHHRAKHVGGWMLDQPLPSVFDWTSPAGRSYRVDTASTGEEGLLPDENRHAWRTAASASVAAVSTSRRAAEARTKGAQSRSSMPTVPCPF